MQRRWSSMDQKVTSLVAIATHGRDEELVEELGTVQSDVLKSIATSINKDGHTVLHVAAVKERMESLMVLIKSSVDMNTKNGSGRSALFKCINHNTLNSARLLLQAGANVNEIICRQTNETLLHRTVKSNRLKAMGLLLDNGCDPNLATRDGETPLHFAARYNRPHTALLLIDAGADVNATNKDGETALHVAIATRSSEMSKLLIQNKKANMTVKDRRGMTPLHAAVAGGCLDLVKMMLSSNSAAINSKESLLGRTPLLLACSTGTQRMASLLLSHGADANLTTHYRKSVLHVAASNGNTGALGAVIKFASNPNALSINNMTPLHYAVRGGHCEIARILLKSGVNANMKDIEGHTSLHIASSAGDNETVTTLLDHKAQANATNMKQQTALHLALMNGHEETGSILIAYGIDATILDIYDKTGADYWEEYQLLSPKHHSKDQHEIDTLLFSGISEEGISTPQSSLGDLTTAKAKQDNDRQMDRLNHNINLDQTDTSRKDISNINQTYFSEDAPLEGTNKAEMNGHTTDYHLANGDIRHVKFSDTNYVESDGDDKILDENENIAFIQNKIEDVDIEDQNETELEHNKDKKHTSNNRRVRKISNGNGKSKKHPTRPKSGKSKSKSNKFLNEDVSTKQKEYKESDCLRQRKTGFASHQ